MIIHHEPDDTLREQATSYALGMMNDDEARRFEDHCRTCGVCRKEMQDSLAAFCGIGSLLEAEPTPSTKSRVMTAIAPTNASDAARRDADIRPDVDRSHGHVAGDHPALQPWKAWNASKKSPMTFVFGGDGAFEPTAIPGIEARRLYVDEEGRRTTMLVRMAPGTSYPSHRHGGFEECFVLSGDLRVGDTVMHAGDYQFCRESTIHVDQSTEQGCLLFLVSSLDDDII